MHDLRKKVLLERGKTESKKAKYRQVSGVSSKHGSPAASRNSSRMVSRHGSDEDEGYRSDSTGWSLISVEDSVSPEEAEGGTGWVAILEEQIVRVANMKRLGIEGREDTLQRLVNLLKLHYAESQLAGCMDDLLLGVLKRARAGDSELEVTLALKAVALLLITKPSNSSYELVGPPMKQLIGDSQNHATKAAAIHVYSTAASYGGAGDEEIEQVMAFLHEIVESDGSHVEAEDSDEVVTAALEEWGFLATQIDDLEHISEEVMEGLVEQLDSSHVNVQIAAGENIALLYEKSHTELEEDEEPPPPPPPIHPLMPGSNGDSERQPDEFNSEYPVDGHSPLRVKRYNVYSREHQLRQRLAELSKVSSKHLSKRDRKALHSNFSDILHTVENPSRAGGPRYSTAIDQETGKVYGSQMTVGVGLGSGAGTDGREWHGQQLLCIRTWEQLIRLRALRRLLGAGFLVHYAENEVVFETLPLLVEDRDRDRDRNRNQDYKGRRARKQRRK